MWGLVLIFLGLLSSFLYFIFNLAPIELNVQVSEMKLPIEMTKIWDKYLNFKNNAKKVSYTNTDVFDVDNDTTKTINWLLFEIDLPLNETWSLFIPDKNDLWNYMFTNLTKIEMSEWAYLYQPLWWIIWSFSYSGSTSTGYVINTIDNSNYCYFDSSLNTCN